MPTVPDLKTSPNEANNSIMHRRRTHPHALFLTRLVSLACLALLTYGCESTAGNRPARGSFAPIFSSNGNDSGQPIQFAEPKRANLNIGKIVWYDPQKRQVVVELTNRFLNPQEALVSRDKDNTVTALLNPTGLRRGKAVGCIVEYGTPYVGDEVVLRSVVEQQAAQTAQANGSQDAEPQKIVEQGRILPYSVEGQQPTSPKPVATSRQPKAVAPPPPAATVGLPSGKAAGEPVIATEDGEPPQPRLGEKTIQVRVK